MNCPLCGYAASAVFATWPDFTVQQCRRCAFRFVDTAAPEYPRNAQHVYDEVNIGAIKPDQPHIRRRVADILRFKRPPGRALDIGCGSGEVSLALHGKGFVCEGVDMKPRVISQLQARFPQVTWRCASAGELAEAPWRFDVLSLYHVLEHIADPKSALARVKTLANPGALIVIEVPHVGGWEARLKGRSWHYYKVDHVNYFRESDLHVLASELDMQLLEVRGYQHFSYPQDVLWKDMVKGALARLGFRDVISVFLRVT
jgi:2-polyprenyl-3-methyl-5-hydroxy-6-metoxy-1,4-benzoquinol methylase